MKKLILTAALMLSGLFAFAQTGIVGGFSSSTMELEHVSFKSAAGYNVGLAYRCSLGAGFFLQPALIYNVKAATVAKALDATTVAEVGDLAKMGYVEIPLQVQWGVNLMVIRPYVLAEPFVGCAVNGLLVSDDGGKTKVNFNGIADRLEYGLGVGAGVELFSKIQLSAKYYWNFDSNGSFNSLINNVSSTISEGRNFDGLVISLGLFF